MNKRQILKYLRKIHACSESLRWVESQPEDCTWESLWSACPRGGWLSWLVWMWADRNKIPYGSDARAEISRALLQSDGEADEKAMWKAASEWRKALADAIRKRIAIVDGEDGPSFTISG